jgi:MFS-type transporter involved in bile tolerance (Atg22 family)
MIAILPTEVRDPGPAGSNGRAPTLAVWFWVLYDFSNTIFSIGILSYFFPLWLREELGAGPDLFNYISAASALIIALTTRLLGALGDLRQRRRPYLNFLTVLAVAVTGGLDLADNILAGTLLAVLFLWLVSTVLVAEPLVGIFLGATWTVSRIMLVPLSAPEKLSEFFGPYSIAGRLSAITGPALIAILLTIFDDLGTAFSYRIAVGSLTFVMMLGIFFLARVPDVRPDRTVQEYAPEALVQSEGPPLIRRWREWERSAA